MAGTNLGTAYVTIMPSAKGMGSALSQQMNSEGSVAGNSFGGGLAKAAIGALAAAGIGVAVKKFFSDAIEAGGALQQSFGGLDTIYGDAADGMKELAYEAAQAGISANDYAEQAVSFGASLKQAFGGDTKKAAESANMAIMDMADNAAKMGTDVSMLQNAYQGFAKQNYTMLDNLKLGYGGTKTEMERLLADAEKLSGVHYDISNLGDVYEAIHVVQEELGLTGVAAQEGAETFTGSMGAMKASAENLMANLALGEDIKEPLTSLVENTKAFLLNNLFPMIGNVLKQLPGLIGEGLMWAFDNIPNLVDTAISFLNKLTAGMSENSGVFKEKLVEIGHAALEMFKNIDWKGLGTAVIDFIWTGLQLVGGLIWDGLKAIGSLAVEKMKEVDWKQLGLDIIKFIWNGLGEIGHWIWDKLKMLGDAAVEKMKEIDWIQLGKDVIKFIWNGLGEIGHWIWEKLKNLGEAAVNKVKEIDWLQLGKDIINWIVEGLLSIGENIVDAVKGFAQDAYDAWTGQTWEEAGRNTAMQIQWGAVNENLPYSFYDIAYECWEQFQYFDWFSVGSSIVVGIANGLWAYGSSITSALQAQVSTAYNNICNTLWMHSPSRFMKEKVGKNIALGIAEGIEAETPAVNDAMLGIADNVTSAIDTGFAYSATLDATEGGAQTATGGIVINVYPSAGMDERALAEMVEQRLTLAQRQRQAAWGTA